MNPQVGAEVQKIRYNVYAKQKNVNNPSLIFNTHIDTVPPFFPARMDDTNLYGIVHININYHCFKLCF